MSFLRVNRFVIKFPFIGSFFSFPALGSGSNSVSVYAENRINVERSIRLLNHLVKFSHKIIQLFCINWIYELDFKHL
jgi:hypothetical protein